VHDASLSADGQFVAFVFDGPDLTGGGCKGAAIYVRDLDKGVTTRVANAPAEPSEVRISGDGRFVVFTADVREGAKSLREVLRHDLRTGATTIVSLTDDERRAKGPAGEQATPAVSSSNPAVSADGGEIAFESTAANLADDTRGDNVFVRQFDK
jgi:Tol biopolymer transport system component